MFEAKTRKNFIFYLALHGARYAFPLIITPFLAHYLTSDGFGQYAVINSCVWSSAIFMEFGFYIYGVNRLAFADTDEQVGREVSAIVSAKIALLPICAFAYLTLVVLSGQFTRSPVASILGGMLAISVGGGIPWYFQGRQRGGTAVLIEGVPQLAQLVLFLLLIRSPSDLWLVILIQILAPLTSIIFSAWFIRYRDGVHFNIRLHFDHILPALRGAKPYFIERLCFSFYTAITPTLVSVLAGLHEAAIYSLGDRFNNFLGSLAVPISQTMVPVLTRLAKEDRASWKMSTLVTLFTVLFCGIISVVVFSIVGYVIDMFFSAAYEAAIPAARVFCLAAFISSITIGLSNFIIIPRNAASILTWSALSALAGSMAVLMILTPRYGGVGAAFARVAAETITATILSLRAVALYRETRKRGVVIK
jgi:PST family polysaccharide transporter